MAAVLPNGVEMLALYFAAMQAGWYLTPINHHLVGPEIAYIVQDCEAGAFIGHERYGDACAKAASEIALPAERRFAVGDVAGFRPYAELVDGQPADRPEDRSAGAADALHVGHHRPAQGGAPPALGRRPRRVAPARGGFLMRLFGTEAHDGNVHICGSPLYHTAVLGVRVDVAAPRPPRRADGPVDARRGCWS